MRRGQRPVVVAVVVLVLIALGSPVAPAGAGDERQPLECGVTPTADAVLRHDLVCETGFHFHPGEPAVDIDLDGHTLEVARPCMSSGTVCGAVGGAASLHDGHVVGDLSDIGSIDRVHVEGNVEMGLVYWAGGRPLSITDSVVDGRVRLWRSDHVVRRNIIRGSVYLTDTEQAVRNATVSRNVILEGGISIVPMPIDDPWELSGDFSHNLIVRAPGAGIAIGAVLSNIGPTTIVGNIVVGSAGDGIAIGVGTPWLQPDPPPPATVHVARNVALFNGGHGINDAVPADSPYLTVEDGGGNLAFANATPPQCVGIRCNWRP